MTWEVKELSSNVHRLTFSDVSHGWEQYVLLTTDRHWDNAKSKQKLQLKHLERAKEIDAPIIDGGDLFCAMQGKFDRRKSQDALRVEHRGDNYFDQLLDTAESFFTPYADQFAVLGTGNHETSILSHHQLNLTHNLARRLRRASKRDDRAFAGGYGGYVMFDFRIHKTVKQAINLKYFHGSGGGGAVTKGVIQAQRRAANYPSADIVFTGHVHEAWVTTHTREILSRTGKIKNHTQYHICGPTYKEEYGAGKGGWHVEKGRQPKPVGCAWLRFFYHNERVHVSAHLETI